MKSLLKMPVQIYWIKYKLKIEYHNLQFISYLQRNLKNVIILFLNMFSKQQFKWLAWSHSSVLKGFHYNLAHKDWRML